MTTAGADITRGAGTGKAEPLVTVVIPTYNRAHYILEALESVLAQTFVDREVVLVDDGSVDGTREVLQPYLDRVRYLWQENRGGAAARNHGIRESCGQLIAFLDSDDCWEPHTLSRIVEAFEKNPDVGLVSITSRMMTADGRRTDRVYRKISPGPYFTATDLIRHGRVSCFSVRRELLDRVGPFDETLRSAEECDFYVRLWFHTKFYAIREPLLLRRVHGDNLSRDHRLNAECWLYILHKLRREHPEFVRRNRRIYRRELGKQHLRVARELLAAHPDGERSLAEARRHLRRAVAAYPLYLRPHVYSVWSRVAPRTFAAWRRHALRRQRRRSPDRPR